MRFTNTHPSASHASPYASASLSRKSAGHVTKVTPELSISCRPGWTPDYELIATRIPTLVLPSHAVLSPCSIPLERSKVQSGRVHRSTPITPTIIVTPPGARPPWHSNDSLFSGSLSEFFSDSCSSESTVGQDITIPMSVPLSRSTSHYHSSSSKRRTSSKRQSSHLKATRSRSSRDSSDQYLQVPSPRQHRPRRRRSPHVKPLDRSLSLDLTKVKPPFRVVERDDLPSATPMLARMVLDD